MNSQFGSLTMRGGKCGRWNIFACPIKQKQKWKIVFFSFFFFAQPLRQMFPLPACKIRGWCCVQGARAHGMCAKHAIYAREEGYTYIMFITGLLAWFTDWGSDMYPGVEIMTMRIRMCLNDEMWAVQCLGKWLWKRHIPYPFVNNTVRISWWMCRRKFTSLSGTSPTLQIVICKFWFGFGY